jgi:HK97 family phage major capsid protein
VKTIKEQIADLEATRAAKAARAGEVMQKSLDENRSTDQAEAEEFDTITAELKTIDGDLVRLRALEALYVQKATLVDPTPSPQSAAHSREGVNVKNTQKLEPGIRFARFAMCLGAAKGDHERAFRLAKSRFPEDDAVVNVLRTQAETGVSLSDMIEKANVAGGTTQDTTWAAPLVQYQDFAGDFVDYLRPQTIIGKFGTGNIPSLTRVPFNVRIAGQTSGGSASWVGEGKPKPLTKFDFSTTTIPFTKIAAISVVTEELLRFSNPSAERLVRDGLAGACIARLDIDFIDPGKAAVANLSPASILNGVTPVAASGNGDFDDIARDIRNLWAPFITANNAPTTAVYIMTATTALALTQMVNSVTGARLYPDVSMNGGSLGGVPVIVSEYLDNSAGSAGGLVILANARDIWLADDGGVRIDVSREASLQMDDAPTDDAGTGVEASLVSMWQTNSVAFRAEREIYWAKKRSTSVQYVDAQNWGQI